MRNRRTFILPIVAVLLMPAAPALAGQAAVAQDVREAVESVRRAARTVSRYQGTRNQNRVEQGETQTRTLKLGAGGLLELRNIAGDITITAGGRGDTATVEIIKRARGSSEADAREQLALVRVEVAESAGRAEVRAVYPENRARNQRRNLNVETAYRVVMPAGARVKTDSISGSLSVTGVRGELTLGTISGNITVRDAGQRITGQTISGNVELISAQNDAIITLSSTSGNVTASGVKVRRLELGSISGTVRGRDLQCEQAALHTMSGDVEYTGTLTPAGRYEFKTHSGDVRLVLGDRTGFELEASTFSGEVRSGLPLRLQGQVSRRSRTVRGTFGDGGARVTATSFSGDVILNGK